MELQMPNATAMIEMLTNNARNENRRSRSIMTSPLADEENWELLTRTANTHASLLFTNECIVAPALAHATTLTVSLLGGV